MNISKTKNYGILYIIPTPIGNLDDISYRAIKTLKNVHLIAVENIFHAKILLQYYNINTKIITFNKNNEIVKSKKLILILQQNKNIALISNAGTPLINDPGNYLIKMCCNHSIIITPIPGPCAAITALIASNLSTHRFCYEGYLPSTETQRYKVLKNIKTEERTIIFYETTHRIIKSIKNIIEILGKNRNIALVKELTKKWETIKRDTSYNILTWLKTNNSHQKGEFTIIISGYKKENTSLIPNSALKTLQILQLCLPLSTAIKHTAKIHKLSKNFLYNNVINQKIKINK